MAKIVNSGDVGVALALKDFLQKYVWLGIAHTEDWPIPSDPPPEEYGTRMADLGDIIGIKKIETTSMVKPDGKGSLEFYGQNYSLITDEEAMDEGYAYVYAKTALNWDQEFPIINFCQLFLAYNPKVKKGFENRTYLYSRPIIKGSVKSPFTFTETANAIRFSINDGPAQTILFEKEKYSAAAVVGLINQQLHASGNYALVEAWANDGLVYLQGREGVQKIETFDCVYPAYDILGWPIPSNVSSYRSENMVNTFGRLFWYSNETMISRHRDSREIVEIVFHVPSSQEAQN